MEKLVIASYSEVSMWQFNFYSI